MGEFKTTNHFHQNGKYSGFISLVRKHWKGLIMIKENINGKYRIKHNWPGAVGKTYTGVIEDSGEMAVLSAELQRCKGWKQLNH